MIPDNHISYQAQEDVKKLLKPLDDKYGIHYFNYTLSFPNNTGITLHTDADFYKSWFTLELPMCQFSHQSGWYFWENCSSSKMIDLAKILGIGKGILHIEHTNDMIITSAFAMRPERQNEVFLLNNLNLLKGFTAHFQEEAKNIINQAKKELISYTPSMIASLENDVLSKQQLSNNPQDWAFGPLEQLSNREQQCFYLMLKGYSMYDMSKLLGLSASSVNMYIARIKHKLKCDSKQALIDLAQRYGIVSYHLTLPC